MARVSLGAPLVILIGVSFASAQIPHHQDRPPGPALSPAEAIAKMRVPEGFEVKLFAAEPDVINPVAMTFDERGRVWITESVEYPRHSPGKGRDRIKILDDIDRDGVADKVTIFAEGLNIPSGIAVGYGGVFVANAPDLLFLRDTNGDDKADTTETLLTGFGRTDTHELPNCLMWGPDGWLYGLNGVFNHCSVTHQGKTHNFTCALWRYHPKTKAFELFSEGTSNPWGLDYDANGNFFISACVIDHLWHLTETGYYHRQGGPYPPFTWKIESIVKHKHQKAAYCGFCVYQGNAYPKEYRDQFFMGNIHGGCINSDSPQRQGASYFATGRPDFLTADDAWFMPVVQKVGPDGCLWIADWYDRYHCYQDANRDPKGIERLKGRIYRVTYRKTPTPPAFNLKTRTDDELLSLLGDSNGFYRRHARQLLTERNAGGAALEKLVRDRAMPPTQRMEALWTRISQGPLPTEFHIALLNEPDPAFRAWGVRAAGGMGEVDSTVRDKVIGLTKDPSPDVRLQVAIAARKLKSVEPLPILLEVLASAHADPSGLTPRICWRNIEPLLDTKTAELVAWLQKRDLEKSPAVAELMERILQRVLATSKQNDKPLLALLDYLLDSEKADQAVATESLYVLFDATLNGALDANVSKRIRERFEKRLINLAFEDESEPMAMPALALLTLFRNERAIARLQEAIVEEDDPASRLTMLQALLEIDDDKVLDVVGKWLRPGSGQSKQFLLDVFEALSRSDSPRIGTSVLAVYDSLDPETRPQALDLLSSRPVWAGALMDAIDAKRIPPDVVNVNQIRKLTSINDAALRKRVHDRWGQVRTERNPNRERVIEQMRGVLAAKAGNAFEGKKVFQKVCAQCHKIHGEGNTVGPEITSNGRASLEQILSNLLDPSLVIGKDYQARILVTTDGQTETGLVAEDSADRVVLKVAGGKEKIFPRSEIEEMRVSNVSLMPEDLEKQLKEQEFRDLFAFLVRETAPPVPVGITLQTKAPSESRRLDVEQSYGQITVRGRASADQPMAELLTYRHSHDGRPYLHPLRVPGDGPELTRQLPNDPHLHHGLFFGHPSVDGVDCLAGAGHVRSEGLDKLIVADDHVSFTAVSDWLSRPLQGERLLRESQTFRISAPDANNRYHMDISWKVVPARDLVFDPGTSGGLGLQLAAHRQPKQKSVVTSSPPSCGWALSGEFGDHVGGVMMLEDSRNPDFPAAIRYDSGRLWSVVTDKSPLKLKANQPIEFGYRIVVRGSRWSDGDLEAESKRFAAETKAGAQTGVSKR